ncbi:hypothetical protein R3P38DRAFT_2576138 [Favolaschia claudopus]|uniref:Uncharacterized protein n=1 Tax=Favolaschia claudopus TaxID=2862362 RepID=A0AAV9ZJG4_9AGAR
MHASFGDFIMKPSHKPWSLDVAVAKNTLASGCLAMLQKQLKFNICNFPDSHLSNKEVTGSEKFIADLPDALTYASQFWGSHLADSMFDDKILVLLKEFLGTKFLFWSEVVSLRQEVVTAAFPCRNT